MIQDQATALRQLAQQLRPGPAEARTHGPKTVVLAGGKGGVGTTTIAVNLAVALANRSGNTLLLSLDPGRHDAWELLRGLSLRPRLRTEGHAIKVMDLDAGGQLGICTLAEFLLEMGVRAFDRPESTTRDLTSDWTAGLGHDFDWVVVDSGNASTPHARAIRAWADLLVAVTSPESTSLLNAYAMIREHHRSAVPIWMLVNRAHSAAQAADLFGRARQTAARFLQLRLGEAGHVLLDPAVAAAQNSERPVVLDNTATLAAQQLCALARQIRTHFEQAGRRTVRPTECPDNPSPQAMSYC